MRPEQAKFETLEERRYQPRALLFRTLTLLWVFPSLGACWMLWTGADWRSGGLGVMTLEQWVAVALLVAHVHFVILALFLRRVEVPVPAPGVEDEMEEGGGGSKSGLGLAGD